MIKAIIFDFGGVIIKDQYTKYVGVKTAEFQLAEDYANKGEPPSQELSKVIEKLSPLTPQIYSSPDNQIIELIKTLKLKYKVGLLSNNFTVWTQEAKKQEYMQLFDVAIFSSDVKLSKPGPKIYEYAAQQFGVKPFECVFIDNIEENVQGARFVGMKGIWYKNFEQLIKDLNYYGVEI